MRSLPRCGRAPSGSPTSVDGDGPRRPPRARPPAGHGGVRSGGGAGARGGRPRGGAAAPAAGGARGLSPAARAGARGGAPPADPSFRRELAAIARREGRPALWERLRSLAPEIAARLHPNDEVRVIRALEIVRGGGGALYGAGRWRGAGGPSDGTYVGVTL